MKPSYTLILAFIALLTISGCKRAIDFDTMYFGVSTDQAATLPATYEIRYDGAVYYSDTSAPVRIGKLENDVLRDIDEMIQDLEDATWSQNLTDIPVGGSAKFIEMQTGDTKQRVSWDASNPDSAPADARALHVFLEEVIDSLQ